jgi:hypothetical protein
MRQALIDLAQRHGGGAGSTTLCWIRKYQLILGSDPRSDLWSVFRVRPRTHTTESRSLRESKSRKELRPIDISYRADSENRSEFRTGSDLWDGGASSMRPSGDETILLLISISDMDPRPLQVAALSDAAGRMAHVFCWSSKASEINRTWRTLIRTGIAPNGHRFRCPSAGNGSYAAHTRNNYLLCAGTRVPQNREIAHCSRFARTQRRGTKPASESARSCPRRCVRP